MLHKQHNPMDERLKFVARLLHGEKTVPLCREFGISRKSGCKMFNLHFRHPWRSDENHVAPLGTRHPTIPGFPGLARLSVFSLVTIITGPEAASVAGR